jgi:phosphoserine phosphatase
MAVMSHVATLVSNPKRPAVDAAAIAKARALLPNAISESLLKPGIAADIFFAPGPDAQERALSDLVRAALAPAPIDVVVQETKYRRKKLFVADMDSTMIDQECIDELAAEAGVGERVASITARAMNGELNFHEALIERVGLLAGLPESTIQTVLDSRITLASGGAELVATMRKHGAYAALVSGGFTSFTGPIARQLGFDENRANTLLSEAGVLTGHVTLPVLGREAKVEALNEIVAARGLTPADVIAVGDGANDLGMLQLAGSGVALHAKPVVAAQAGITINHGDLTALLYLQGYSAEEFSR